jgi:hypothetical protein
VKFGNLSEKAYAIPALLVVNALRVAHILSSVPPMKEAVAGFIQREKSRHIRSSDES